jgi:hypothetical protein
MNTKDILEAIDQQISKLQQARTLLSESPTIQAKKPVAAKRRGRPKGSVNQRPEAISPATVKTNKRTMSAEGKARIAAAQKARWSAQKATKPPAKNVATRLPKKAVDATKLAAKKIAAKVSKKATVPNKKSIAGQVAEA